MSLLDSFPVLLIDDGLTDATAAGRATRAIVLQLENEGVEVIVASDLEDARQILGSLATVSTLLIDWDSSHRATSDPEALADRIHAIDSLVEAVRHSNPTLPVVVLADRSPADVVPLEVFRQVNEYVWKLEDTPNFIAAHIAEARREYLEPLLPPFFGALVKFTEEARYSWHTPGHSGGTAFLKSPSGSAFHEFFGENTLRSDLSVSVGELGSLMEHSGPVGAAEAEAARVFGADRTLFVTNGTSTANKIAFHSSVRRGDVVLVDRNCHKSIMHAIIMTGAIPVYLHPSRNAQGIIGPIPPSEFDGDHIRALLAAHPLVPDGTLRARLAVVTNSTYDGLCYAAVDVFRSLSDVTSRVLFDEAWFAYAHFHPLYANRHAMGIPRDTLAGAAVIATQSTHKLLAAFSQGSMVHVADPGGVIDATALGEAFMMHTSTSPQYGIIASLDVSTKMMTGPQGTALIDESMEDALSFRREIVAAANDVGPDDWAFGVWQPPHVTEGTAEQQRDPKRWILRDGDHWHGYRAAGHGHALLDPIKVTVLTPGISKKGVSEELGIPAALVSRFLDERGIVVEKTGSYSFLVLFSLGITRGKAGTLLAELFDFKRLHDRGAPLSEALPRLVSEDPERYGSMTLPELASSLHNAMRASSLAELTEGMYADLPQPVVTPSAAFEQLVGGTTETVALSDLAGRVSAVMIVPYPPGIPVIMPGERFTADGGSLLSYLRACEQLGIQFPSFETEIHGIQIASDGSYSVPCLPE